MTAPTAFLRAEAHGAVGAILLRDAGAIVERWATRAKAVEPSAARVHHDVLLDHIPNFLWELGHALAYATAGDRHCGPARIHGDQRWEAGWSVEEVVRDYQLLRLVVVEHLDGAIARPLTTREVLALGVFIDDAIAASIAAYTASRDEIAGPPGRGVTADREDLLAILGVLGHELRNPLAPFGNALEILKARAADASAVARVRSMMERQFKVMTRLVDDLLDLPRLLRGKMRLQTARIDLAALVRDAVEDRRAAFGSAGIRISLDLPPESVFGAGDPLRLGQVLGNMLANAIKFTDRDGEVRVRFACDAERRLVILSVRDTGIGIERSVLPNIFEPFVQADRSVERSRGGLGLGLALVKGLVELHGGSIRAASDGPGKGSEFVVELPWIENPAADAPIVPANRLAPPRRVLVIEDDTDSADSLKMFL